MTPRVSLLDVFHGKKSMLVALAISVTAFLAIELIIFIVFAASSGEHSRIQVRDRTGKTIYDVAGSTLSHINFSYFERKYGDLANYDVEVRTISRPFPVRAWVSASVGVPIVLILRIAYLVKVYLTLLQGEERPNPENLPAIHEKMHPFISWSLLLNSSSIFWLGTAVAGLALVFWMVPNFLGEVAAATAAAIIQSGWLLPGGAVFLACIVLWVVYLRYRLSRRMMDYHYRLEAQRLERQSSHPEQLPLEKRESAIETRNEA
jgi:hypothetical protein